MTVHHLIPVDFGSALIWACACVCVCLCVCSCLAVWSHHRVSDILKSEPNELWKSRNYVPDPKPKTQVKSITTTTTKTKEIILKIQQQTTQKKNTFVLGGVARKPQRFLGNVLNFIRTILRWGAVRTFPRLRLIWGRTKTTPTTTTKAASERGNFFLHAVFFFSFCAWSSTGPASAPRSTSRSHGVVLLEDLFGRPVRSVGLSLVVNNKMFCFNHIVASSYAYALAEGEGDRRAWDSFSFTFAFAFTFAFTLLVPLPLLQLRFLLLFFHHISCCCFGCFLHLAASARSSFLWAALVIVVVVVVVIVL